MTQPFGHNDKLYCGIENWQYTKFEESIFNGCGDIFDEKFGEKERNKQKEDQIGECPFAIPRYNWSLWTCIPNTCMKFLSLTVVEIPLTKNLERKKNKQKERTNRRMPICNPTIQLVVVDLYTIYEVSILNGCGDIFDEIVLRNYGQNHGQM